MTERVSIAAAMTKLPRGYTPRKFVLHAILADGSHQPLDAEAIYVDMGEEGRDLLICLHERFHGEGISISNLYANDSPGGRMSISPGAANIIYVNVDTPQRVPNQGVHDSLASSAS